MPSSDGELSPESQRVAGNRPAKASKPPSALRDLAANGDPPPLTGNPKYDVSFHSFMRVTPKSPASADDSRALRERILAQARTHFFGRGYASWTMDELATELGMSKKTLYVHFSGKDEIVAHLIDTLAAELRNDADLLLADRGLNFAEKLRGFVESMLERVAPIDPRALRDLQRFAPQLFQRLEDVREKMIPYIFGRFVEEGQLSGVVRTNLPASVAIAFFLHAMQGLMHPTSLERLRMAPRDMIPIAIDLFFGGLLTPTGRKQYEKLFPR